MFPLDFDYAILTYSWTGDNGTDLDTRTSLSTPERLSDIGWARLAQDSDYIIWGRDNQTPIGEESVLINFNNIKRDYPDTLDIRFRLRTFWYTSKIDGNLKLTFSTYSGGTVTRVGTKFVVNKGRLVSTTTSYVNSGTVIITIS